MDYSHKMCSIICVTGGQCFSYNVCPGKLAKSFPGIGAALDAIPYSEHPVAEKITWLLLSMRPVTHSIFQDIRSCL